MDEELKELLKENNEMLKAVLKISKMTKKYVVWQQIFSLLKILIFVIPLILGIMYLPSILEDVLTPYKELLNMGGQAGADLESATPDFLKSFMK